jgi:hypothetical protein
MIIEVSDEASPATANLSVSCGKQKHIKSDVERRFVLIELRLKVLSEDYSATAHTDLHC